jgi:hypothetical protein
MYNRLADLRENVSQNDALTGSEEEEEEEEASRRRESH